MRRTPLALVVAATALAAGCTAASAPRAARTSSLASPGSPAPPSPTASAALAIDCGDTPQRVQTRRRIALGAARGTLVVATCAAGAGSPPDAVLLYAGAPGRSRLLDTLVPMSVDEMVTGLQVRGDRVTVQGLRYSTQAVPRCCPDRTVTDRWVVAHERARRVDHVIRARPMPAPQGSAAQRLSATARDSAVAKVSASSTASAPSAATLTRSWRSSSTSSPA